MQALKQAARDSDVARIEGIRETWSLIAEVPAFELDAARLHGPGQPAKQEVGAEVAAGEGKEKS
jgi:hypothetical protein